MGLILGSGNTKPEYPYDMWYGVEGDFTSIDPQLKRVGNLDLHRSLPIQSRLKRFVENQDGSVKYYLHQNDSRKKDSGAAAIIDSTDGNVMLEIPEYYLRVEIDGTKWIYAISEYPLPGFNKIERKAISPWYGTIDLVNDTAVSGCFLKWDGDEIARDSNGFVSLTDNAAQFRGGTGKGDADKDGTYNSMLGMPRVSVAKSKVRRTCKNGTHIGAYRAYNQIAWLQRIEYANRNCQDAYSTSIVTDGFSRGGLGSGPSVDGSGWGKWGGYRPFLPSGVTAILGNNTGKVSYTIKNFTGGDKVVQVTSYRGFENPFEYLWMLADDILVWHKKDISTVYVCEDPTKFTSHSDSDSTAPDGYVGISELPRGDGYINTMSLSSRGFAFPLSTKGAGGASGFCDYFSTPVGGDNPSYGWFGALFSGSALNGAAAGFGYLGTNDRSSTAGAAFGVRLCRF